MVLGMHRGLGSAAGVVASGHAAGSRSGGAAARRSSVRGGPREQSTGRPFASHAAASLIRGSPPGRDRSGPPCSAIGPRSGQLAARPRPVRPSGLHDLRRALPDRCLLVFYHAVPLRPLERRLQLRHVELVVDLGAILCMRSIRGSTRRSPHA